MPERLWTAQGISQDQAGHPVSDSVARFARRRQQILTCSALLEVEQLLRVGRMERDSTNYDIAGSLQEPCLADSHKSNRKDTESVREAGTHTDE